jgi:hypothetical protein
VNTDLVASMLQKFNSPSLTFWPNKLECLFLVFQACTILQVGPLHLLSLTDLSATVSINVTQSKRRGSLCSECRIFIAMLRVMSPFKVWLLAFPGNVSNVLKYNGDKHSSFLAAFSVAEENVS